MRKNTFSENLIRLRKLKGFSQEELAQKTGLSKRIIAYYEKETNNDFLDKLTKISNALEVPISLLIGKEKTDLNKYKNIYDIDVRLLKKLKMITSLPIDDQKAVNSYLDMVIERNTLKNKQEK
jgi:transcriptional regulator with XRE-family HTH domain